jgi:S-(hydroxymethyl)glutathione dehydrogenase / alcohol dehydrogenase
VNDFPKKMKAAILVEQNKPLVVDEIELPDALGFGQVLVKVHYSGLCGSQLGEIDGVKGEDRFLPHLLGHEGAATVLAVGPGVKHVKTDDTVVLHWRKGRGFECDPPAYRWNGRRLNAGWITTLNEYAVVSENRCTPIPQDSDLEVAALFGCAVTTGFGVVENNARIRIGESVVIFGAGGIGLNIVQAASLVSAYPIVAVDLHDNRLELATEMGATHIVNGNLEEVREQILKITGNAGVDCFIDNTGHTEIIEVGYQITKTKGRVILVGVPRIGENINIYSLPLHFGKSISGSHGGDGNPNLDIPRYQNLYRNGRIKLRELISDIYRLEEINGVIDSVRMGKVRGRCLINMS